MLNRALNVSTVTITRPANTTAYTAKDVVGQADVSVAANAGTAILTFAEIGSGAIILDEVRLRVDLNAVPANMGAFILHLYDEAPAAILDNAAANLVAADRSKYLGQVALNTPVDNGDTLWITASPAKSLLLKSTSLYGVLETVGNYTPTSGEVLAVTLVARPAG